MQYPSASAPPLNQATSCLHLVVGAGDSALGSCLSQAGSTDAVLFLDAGVLHLLQAAPDSPNTRQASVYYSAADLHAHGLSDLARRQNVDILDDTGFCELLAAHRHCLTWA